jgi:hypothetical protein
MKKIITLCLVISCQVLAQWSNDPTLNTPISTASNSQYVPVILSDGSGGAIIAWEDFRNGFSDIYAQRVNASRVVQWATDGVAICTATGDQDDPTIASDGLGGAIITWVDFRSGSNADIYAQRINASGVAQWTANGVVICSATAGIFSHPTILSDGSGGAIITWVDERNGAGTYDIYAQRIDASGVVQWTANGVAICTATNHQLNPDIVSDGSDGAIISWVDFRNGSQNDDIYSQRINASGVVGWDTNGVAICIAPDSQQDFSIVADGSGGAIITWRDRRSIFDVFDIYAQRISASGVVEWDTNGVAISTATGDQFNPAIVSDSSGKAIIIWEDTQNGITNVDIYAQQINTSGVVEWDTNGVAICSASGNQLFRGIISDGSGGAIITWVDGRNGSDNEDIYAQRINASGVVQWIANGIEVSTASQDQQFPILVSDGSGGAIITWQDFRNGTSNVDIYAQRIYGNGTLTSVRVQSEQPSGFSLEQNYPNPFNPSTTIQFSIPEQSFVKLEIFNTLGEKVSTLVSELLYAGSYKYEWSAGNLPSGIYFYRLISGGQSITKKLMLTK